MHVDSTGKAVGVGTYGLYRGSFAARIIRTFVDPTVDEEDVQEGIANGGYIVTMGKEEKLCDPSDFTMADHGPDVVIAQDGKEVHVGDEVRISSGNRPRDDEGPYIVKNLYPLRTLAGETCLSLEDHDGGAPDGKWSIQWGKVLAVTATAAEVKARGEKKIVYTKGMPSPVPLDLPRVGDRIKFLMESDYKTVLEGVVSRTAEDNGDYKTPLVTFDSKQPNNCSVGSMWHVLSKIILEHTPKGALMGSAPSTAASTQQQESQSMPKAKKEVSVGKVDMVREGTQIILPAKMGLRTAIKELERQAEQEEMEVNIMELIPGFPLDAAHAFVQALAQQFGWVNALPTPGFFGPTPPTMIGLQVDPDGTTVQIPWGKIGIPGLSGALQTGIQFVDNRPTFCIGGTIKQKDKELVNGIAKMTKDYLREHSIYKGKAIRVKFATDPKKFSPLDHQPKFIATSDVRPDELVFSKDVDKQVRINIWTPIQALAAVKAAKVPLKRGVLLYGRYGVGKTLLASVTARMSVMAGVTFMDLEDSRQLPQAVQFARMLGGMVVIFAEDVDRCDEDGSRTDAFNEILNTVDGLTSKTDEVLIVYTTNHVERISKAMLRQGRIDKVIHIKEPDAEAAQRLVRLYARHMLAAQEDLTEVGELLAGFIPAAIREVVEQSKLSAIERGDVHHITAEDLRVTAENTKEHMALLKETPTDTRSELEKFGDAIGARVADKLGDVVSDALENDSDAADAVREEVNSFIKRRAA